VTRNAPREALEAAYRRTLYRVAVPGRGPLDLRVGRRSRRLDRLLAALGCRDWAFVTAWNPGSRSLPAWRNALRSRRLARALERLGYCTLLGLGVADDDRWRSEVSLLVVGMPAARALRIARLFGQNAIVAGRRGGDARLLWCRRLSTAQTGTGHRLIS